MEKIILTHTFTCQTTNIQEISCPNSTESRTNFINEHCGMFDELATLSQSAVSVDTSKSNLVVGESKIEEIVFCFP